MTDVATMKTEGKWTRLDDGTWGIDARTGGRGERYIGRTLVVRRKDKTASVEVLGELVADYGDGDVATYRVAS